MAAILVEQDHSVRGTSLLPHLESGQGSGQIRGVACKKVGGRLVERLLRSTLQCRAWFEPQSTGLTADVLLDFGLELAVPRSAVVYRPSWRRWARRGARGVRGVRAGARAHVLPTGEDMVWPPTGEATAFFALHGACVVVEAWWARHQGWWRPPRLVATPSTASTHRRVQSSSSNCPLQVKTLGKFFAMSFSWGFFQWFYTGGKDCGFSSFPTLGLEARKQKFFFDFFPGAGHVANEYLLLGRFATSQSRFFFDFFPAASAASSATGCYLFWTMELDLLDLEPVQILSQCKLMQHQELWYSNIM
ncbi:hypothetical protein ZWY2020_045193 [Hordeum vulgare]|nr:hypothetical protein ZWY2020_045193 [Hordeum vulgare]